MAWAQIHLTHRHKHGTKSMYHNVMKRHKTSQSQRVAPLQMQTAPQCCWFPAGRNKEHQISIRFEVSAKRHFVRPLIHTWRIPQGSMAFNCFYSVSGCRSHSSSIFFDPLTFILNKNILGNLFFAVVFSTISKLSSDILWQGNMKDSKGPYLRITKALATYKKALV